MTLLTSLSVFYWVLVFWTWTPLNVQKARQEWTCSSVVLPGIVFFFVFSKLTTRLRHFQTLVSKSHVRMLLATFKCFSRQSDFQKLIVGSATSKVCARCWTSCRTLRYGDFALNSSLGGAVLLGWSFHWFVQKILFLQMVFLHMDLEVGHGPLKEVLICQDDVGS